MVKYTYKTVTYVLPESIKKINNDVRLQNARSKKEDIKREIANKEQEIDNALGNEKKRLERERDQLKNELTKINNTIFDIKADLYGSTVNFNNSNIRNLSANINDIKSVINDTSKLNDDIVKKISEILTNQIDVNNIFDTDNFRNFLESIKNEVDPGKKFNYPEEFDKLSKALEQFKDSLKSNEENSEIWKDIKTSVENLIPTEKLNNIINNYTEKINDIISLKTNLAKRIFDKEIDEVSDKDLNSYIKNFNLLNDLFTKANKTINNRELGDLANPQMNKKLKIPKNEHFVKVLNNLRKWFSEDEEIDTGILSNSKNLFISNMNTKKLWDENIKDINPDIIKEADLLIESIIHYDETNPSSNRYEGKNKSKPVISQEQNIIQDVVEDDDEENKSEGLSKGLLKQSSSGGLSKQSSSGGLDLDEIQFWRSLSSTNLNIMNNIIKSLNDINETLKGIKESLTKQNNSQNQKLGRFKVEKYNPNMSIIEFKKLFDTKP